jgi:hypothetical protein
VSSRCRNWETCAVVVLPRAGHREHPHPASPVDLDAELHVLTWDEAAPGAVGSDHDRAGVTGLVDDPNDTSAHLIDGEERVDLLQEGAGG